jgi:HlyD family secretion protein
MHRSMTAPPESGKGWLGVLAAVSLLVLGWIFLRPLLFPESALPVRVARVEHGPVEDIVTASEAGSIRTRFRTKVAADVLARIKEIRFREGDTVERGKIVMMLDDRAPAAALAVAQADLVAGKAVAEEARLRRDLSLSELRRNEDLKSSGIVSDDAFERIQNRAVVDEQGWLAAQARVAQLEAAVESARVILEKYAIPAPFTGVISELLVEVGETTSMLGALPLFEMLDLTSLYGVAKVDEVDLPRVRVGLAVRLTLDAMPGHPLMGEVLRIAPFVSEVEEHNRTVEIEIGIPGIDNGTPMVPGMSTTVEVIVARKDRGLRIPTAALLPGRRVFVVENGRAAERSLVVGLANWEHTEVVSGLAEEDVVILSVEKSELVAGVLVRAEDEKP